MSRLTPEERREYEEEAEYAAEHGNIRQQHHPSTYERIVGAAKNVGTQIKKFDQGPTGQALRKHAERINAQDSGLGGSGARSRARAVAQPNPATGYARFSNDAPVNEESTLHPGHRIIVVEGTVLASARMPGSAPAEPRRRRSGGLGGGDPGFGNDRGL